MAGEADAIAISGGGDGGWGGGWGGGGAWALWLMNQQICDGDKEIIGSIASNHCDVVKAIGDSDGRINLHLASMQAGLSSQICDAKTAALLASKDQALEMCRMQNALQVQISGVSHQIDECCCKLERQIEACCCKLEMNISTSALDTQRLIQAQEAQKLRDQLAAEQQKNLFFQFNNGGGRGGDCRGGH